MSGLFQRIVATVMALVVAPCLEEEESYAIRSRKLVVIAFACISGNALPLGMPASILGAIYDPTFGVYFVGAALLQVTFTSAILPYLYIRNTKRLPDWLPTLQIWSTVPTTLGFCLFAHQGSVIVVNSFTTMMGVVMRIQGWQMLIVYGVAINLIHALINDYGEQLPGLHETLFHTQILSVKILYLVAVNLCPVIFFGLGLYGIMTTFVQRSNQADAAIAMNLAVAEKLRRYDTDAVAFILAENEGKVDDKLLVAFRAIQRNLEEYRPHIPDYVIAATTSDSAESDDDSEEGSLSENILVSGISTPRSVHELLSVGRTASSNRSLNYSQPSGTRHAAPTKPVAALEVPPTLGAWGTSTLRTLSNGPAAHRDSGSPVSARQHDQEDLAASTDSQQSSTNRSVTTADISIHIPATTQQSQKAHQQQHFFGKATTVLVRFVGASVGSDGRGDGSVTRGGAFSAMKALNQCIEAAARHAKSQGGALQYMQGCALMVSFNAVSRIASHEVKACSFALALQASIDLITPKVAMHASVVTSNVLSFFSGGKSQLMLTVLGGFMPVHTAMHHYLSQTIGDESSCVLMNNGVAQTVEMFFVSRRIGAVKIGHPTHPSKRAGESPLPPHYERQVVLTQLLRASTHSHNEEWLYNTQTSRSDPAAEALQSLVDMAVLGDGAVTCNPPWPEGCDIIEERCVYDRLTLCRDTGCGFALTVLPTAIW